MDTVEQERLGRVMASCVNLYKQNDPADSASGSQAGVAVRVARRRVAVEHLQICLDIPTYDEALECMKIVAR